MHSIADVAAVGAQNGYLLECRFDTNPFTNPFSRGWHPIRLPIRLPIHFLVVNQYAAVGAQNIYLLGNLIVRQSNIQLTCYSYRRNCDK